MNVLSLHIEPTPPPRADPSIHVLRMKGYYKHIEVVNLLIQQS